MKSKSVEELTIDLLDRFDINSINIKSEKRNIKDNDFMSWFIISCEKDSEIFYGESYNLAGALQQLLKDLLREHKPHRVKRSKLLKETYNMEGIMRYE